MKYDYIIQNGSVFDSRAGNFTRKDIFIADGTICTPAEGADNQSEYTINALGKYVVPGLIDAHCHLNYAGSNIGANADLLCIPSGVTTAVDAGTTGYANFPLFYQGNIVRSTTDVMAYLHCSPYGVKDHCIHPEEHDPIDFSYGEIHRTVRQYPSIIRGLKLRVFGKTMDNYGLAPIYKAVEMADRLKAEGHHCIVDMHYTGAPSGFHLNDVLSILRSGDMFTHVYQTNDETIFDDQGRIRDCVWEAKKRGVLFNTGNGRPLWSFKNLESAFSQGLYPNIISSDVIYASMYQKPAFSLVHAMCVMTAAGMKIEDVLQAVTFHPAQALGILDRAGTLEEGSCADVAIFDVQESEMLLEDKHGGSRPAKRMFVPLATIRKGKIVYRQIFF